MKKTMLKWFGSAFGAAFGVATAITIGSDVGAVVVERVQEPVVADQYQTEMLEKYFSDLSAWKEDPRGILSCSVVRDESRMFRVACRGLIVSDVGNLPRGKTTILGQVKSVDEAIERKE